MQAEKVYVSLHVHTAKGSVGDSILKIKDYIDRAKKRKLEYLSITNHGSMADMYDFYYECIDAGIKPIIGCEVYETADRLVKDKDDRELWHLVLIAKNDIGLKNLLYIVTDANLNGFYYKPRTDINILKKHGEGIIATSACVSGKIPYILSEMADDTTDSDVQRIYGNAAKKAKEYNEIFDEFYLEIQPGKFNEQLYMNQMMVELSNYTDIPLVTTNDVHYLDKEDWQAHDYHVKIARKKKFDDPSIYPDTCYYLMDYQTISNSFNYLNKNIVDNAVNNTVNIAKQCSYNLSKAIHMPTFTVPKSHTEESYLIKISFDRLEEIKHTLKDPAEYAKRMLYELDVICELGFAGYFLTVRDFVRYAKENGIPVGPGRGSVCGLKRLTLNQGNCGDELYEAA